MPYYPKQTIVWPLSCTLNSSKLSWPPPFSIGVHRIQFLWELRQNRTQTKCFCQNYKISCQSWIQQKWHIKVKCVVIEAEKKMIWYIFLFFPSGLDLIFFYMRGWGSSSLKIVQFQLCPNQAPCSLRLLCLKGEVKVFRKWAGCMVLAWKNLAYRMRQWFSQRVQIVALIKMSPPSNFLKKHIWINFRTAYTHYFYVRNLFVKTFCKIPILAMVALDIQCFWFSFSLYVIYGMIVWWHLHKPNIWDTIGDYKS